MLRCNFGEHSSCLVFCEVPGPAIWCLALTGGNCFRCFSCLSLFSCWNSLLCMGYAFVMVLHSSDILFYFFFFFFSLYSLGFSILEVSIEIFSSPEVFSSAMSSRLISHSKVFPLQCVRYAAFLWGSFSGFPGLCLHHTSVLACCRLCSLNP